jgi:hypothetical protein
MTAPQSPICMGFWEQTLFEGWFSGCRLGARGDLAQIVACLGAISSGRITSYGSIEREMLPPER